MFSIVVLFTLLSIPNCAISLKLTVDSTRDWDFTKPGFSHFIIPYNTAWNQTNDDGTVWNQTNDDGTVWNQTNDGGSSTEGDGRKCIIATVTFGSELTPEVNFLRGFRDNLILSTKTGSSFYIAFNTFYYAWSTPAAQFIDQNPALKLPIKLYLYPLLGILHMTTFLVKPLFDVFPEIGTIVILFLVSSLLGIFYVSPWLFIAHFLKNRRASSLIIRESILKINGLVVVSALLLILLGYLTSNSLVTALAISAYVFSCLVMSSVGFFEVIRHKFLDTSR